MDLLLDEFKSDLTRLKKLQSLIAMLDGFRAHSKPTAMADPFQTHAASIHDAIAASHADLLVLTGAMVLYLAGRFEFYVRERFELACEAIGLKSASLDHLPKPMKDNLIHMTAEVMLNPRKYGHAERGVEAFVRRLAANMTATDGVKDINRECLSVTTENMRPSVLKDLFERAGCKDIWQTISEQACVRTHFGAHQVTEAKSKCMKYLNDFMDVRNKIAHPSNNVEWPALTKVSEYIAFFEVLGKAVSDVIELHETSIPNTIPPRTVPPADRGAGPAQPTAVAAARNLAPIQAQESKLQAQAKDGFQQPTTLAAEVPLLQVASASKTHVSTDTHNGNGAFTGQSDEILTESKVE